MELKNIFALIALVCLLFGCKKESLETSCEDIPLPQGIGFGYQWTKQLPYYDLPCFNPNNADEIIIRGYEKFGDTTFQLLRFNLSTKEKQVVFEGNFAIRPRWSRKDWVLLNLRDFNIYKIKSNGDSLTQLTTGGSCLGAEWDFTGDKFIYQLVRQQDNVSVICDEFGNPLDTLEGSSISPSWQHDSLLTNASPAWLFIQNPNSDELDFEVIQEIGDGGTTTSEWIDNENIIWSYNAGIFSSNIITKETHTIKESCDAKVYMYPTVSFESQKVIFQRDDREVTGTNEGTIQSRLFIMNFDGGCEMEIEIQN